MNKNIDKADLGEEILKFIIKLYESQEKIKVTYTIKKNIS